MSLADGLDSTTQRNIQSAVVTHCENMADRFAILDAAKGSSLSDALAQRAALTSASGFAAMYYPWVWVADPASNGVLLVPPSGHIAGIYARSDNNRGVHKAPANEFISGAVALEVVLNDADQGQLNAAGVNALRVFPGQRPTVWGARTTAPRDQVVWRYINVRRLFIFVEQSLLAGLRWAVFEPNDTGLWKKLERTISEFLTRVWLSGALFGNKASEAFYVKIDEELNPPSVRELGQVIIEIGIAPVRPAEFVIVRLAMWDGGSQASEG
jgi:phage tail sheath protein FI